MSYDPILAYLDPTSGSIGYQVAISGVLAVLATGRLYWRRLRSLFPGAPAAAPGEKTTGGE